MGGARVFCMCVCEVVGYVWNHSPNNPEYSVDGCVYHSRPAAMGASLPGKRERMGRTERGARSHPGGKNKRDIRDIRA